MELPFPSLKLDGPGASTQVRTFFGGMASQGFTRWMPIPNGQGAKSSCCLWREWSIMEAHFRKLGVQKLIAAFPKRCELVQETAENVVGAAMEVSGQQTNLCHNPFAAINSFLHYCTSSRCASSTNHHSKRILASWKVVQFRGVLSWTNKCCCRGQEDHHCVLLIVWHESLRHWWRRN